MFGRTFSEYIRFERWILILIAIVWAIRLGVSLSGASFSLTRWISINIVLLIGLVYCSVAVHTSRFGSYKQLLGLLFIQGAFAHRCDCARNLDGNRQRLHGARSFRRWGR